MKANLTHTAPEPTELEIQHAAYLLWVERGKQPGRDLDNWLAARELLRHRHGRAVVGGRPRRGPAAPAPSPSPARRVPASSSN